MRPFRLTALCLTLALAATPALAQQDEATERYHSSLAKGLDFLVSQQNENGSWAEIPGIEEKGELGITCLSVWALTGGMNAIAPKDSWKQAVDEAVAWILGKQRKDGAFAQPGAGLTTYRTALAIMVLAEVGGHEETIASAREFLLTLQFSEEHGLADLENPRQNPHYGGFGYDKTGTKPDADMSNTQFGLSALKASGLSKDHPAYKRVVVFLQRSQKRSESSDLERLELPTPVRVGNDGGFMYDPGLSVDKSTARKLEDGRIDIPSYASMTYAGLMSMLHAGLSKDDPRVQAAYNWIRRFYTLEENYGMGTREDPGRAKQGLYYYYLVFSRGLSAYGERYVVSPRNEKHDWAADLCDKLVSVQHEDGHWVNEEPRWWESDPVLCTAYAARAMSTALQAAESYRSEKK